jgi:hypothetical protein
VRLYNGIVVICWAVVAAGCVSAAPTSGVDKVLAPGADKVKITRNPADVAPCTAAGNIRVFKDPAAKVEFATAETEFRNQTVGLGANAALITLVALGVPVEGIAYRCP